MRQTPCDGVAGEVVVLEVEAGSAYVCRPRNAFQTHAMAPPITIHLSSFISNSFRLVAVTYPNSGPGKV